MINNDDLVMILSGDSVRNESSCIKNIGKYLY